MARLTVIKYTTTRLQKTMKDKNMTAIVLVLSTTTTFHCLFDRQMACLVSVWAGKHMGSSLLLLSPLHDAKCVCVVS